MSARQRPDMISRKTCRQLFSRRHIFACQAYPALTAAGRGWFAGLGCLLAEYAASLRFQTSALTLTKKARRIPLTSGTHKNGGACRDRTDDLKLAKLPLSQLSYGPEPVGSAPSLAGPAGRPGGPPDRGASQGDAEAAKAQDSQARHGAQAEWWA